MHICVKKLALIGSDNGLSPGRRQAIIWTNAGILSALAIMPSHQQNMHDFADGRKNMNNIFNNYVCSVSHMRSGLHFQKV